MNKTGESTLIADSVTMKFRLYALTGIVAAGLFIFSGIHRVVFELNPNDYRSHWSEHPVVFLTLVLMILIPVQGTSILCSIPKERRRFLLGNTIGFIIAMISFFIAAFIIDPMMSLYAT